MDEERYRDFLNQVTLKRRHNGYINRANSDHSRPASDGAIDHSLASDASGLSASGPSRASDPREPSLMFPDSQSRPWSPERFPSIHIPDRTQTGSHPELRNDVVRRRRPESRLSPWSLAGFSSHQHPGSQPSPRPGLRNDVVRR